MGMDYPLTRKNSSIVRFTRRDREDLVSKYALGDFVRWLGESDEELTNRFRMSDGTRILLKCRKR